MWSDENIALYIQFFFDKFITDFNNAGESQITDIRDGNTSYKAYAYIDESYIEMDDYDNFTITITGNREIENNDAMFSTFKKVAGILDADLNGEELAAAVETWQNGKTDVSDEPLGELTVDYTTSKNLSSGKTDGWIRLSSQTYGK